ncbi:MAG: N-acetylmuramoyl-L-alanine amidase [Actinobacteria bacterium]|jgi:N-acetylmuramoyl-L-alanine amidase|nr:N-acetylmuramoyl-L-alanine amidase [Actinomycetota bacterium]NCV42885.1 N-acetylmuramoyl-L-alanine amidase [Actinomycetota bacterium]NCV82704.1 N-acetylmuramoyl-L-alanine amidase [Actinomycetota bacterium]NCW43547.1 N-acetylmuramoyl-L-alanine amidase [Actinomycetota bacterium]NCW72105.1 N-acetylmuramoyl-L-alanine amidase [Actinomycetota bacterium]
MSELSESQIRSFQQARGLSVTGIVDEVTARALEEAQWKLGDRSLSLQEPPLMHGDDVAALQSRLTEMGFDCGRVDGIYGPRTELAVKDFQKSVGATVDGKCGPATIIALIRLTKIVSGGAPSILRESANQKNRGPALANKTIVLNPDGDDPLVYDVALRTEGRLLALGASVFLTRGERNNPSESERIAFTNSSNADLMISLHEDSYKNENAHGVATYFYGSEAHGVHSIVGERFASLVQREICARTDFANCRTHAMTWDLLRLTKAPAVRIDLGYKTNPGDIGRMSRPDFRDVIAEALVIAIQRLYLAAEDDAKTGTLRISDLRKAGIRR